jgi:hypothetical protein
MAGATVIFGETASAPKWDFAMDAEDVGALPDDPLKMPPPYWRGGSAIFQILTALEDLERYLSDLVPLNEVTSEKVYEYFEQHPEEPTDEDSEYSEFGEICGELWGLEHNIKLKTDAAILMAAIAVEEKLNQFCLYNLHRDIAEPLEKLSPPEKLQVASAILDNPGVKGTQPYEAVQRLTAWRNAFAHGHCTDRPTKTLRHNHLISPAEYPGVPDSEALCIKMLESFLNLSKYLSSINRNPYTAGKNEEEESILSNIKELKKYKFSGNNSVYEVHKTKKGT